jgi:formate C-acetyltransferase
MKNHGPLYNHGQVLMEGVADAVDSLAAIKHFVYDEKKYTMDELVSALEKDFEGYEELHRDLSGYGKFGNEDEESDAIFKDITEHFSNYLLTLKTWRGGVYGAGCSPFNRAANYGKGTGPLPNGKKLSSSLFADSFGAVPGCDKKGATALLNSVLKYDHKLAKSGLVLQLKFDKNVFETQNGMASFIALAKTYMARGGQQLSVNVVSAQDLLEARKYPEKYKSLVVRVGGYSAHFNDLSPELQENIIARTLL